ncbi:hypothetical protein V8C37DRAFT_368009 [Trichoderma ceciliae]
MQPKHHPLTPPGINHSQSFCTLACFCFLIPACPLCPVCTLLVMRALHSLLSPFTKRPRYNIRTVVWCTCIYISRCVYISIL